MFVSLSVKSNNPGTFKLTVAAGEVHIIWSSDTNARPTTTLYQVELVGSLSLS